MKVLNSTRLCLSVWCGISFPVIKCISLKCRLSPFILRTLSTTTFQWIFFLRGSQFSLFRFILDCFPIHSLPSITQNLWIFFSAYNVINWAFHCLINLTFNSIYFWTWFPLFFLVLQWNRFDFSFFNQPYWSVILSFHFQLLVYLSHVLTQIFCKRSQQK